MCVWCMHVYMVLCMCGHMRGCAYELKRLMLRVVLHHSASHSSKQDLSIKPIIAFMVNLDRQRALKSPASSPEGSITGLPPYPHSIYLGRRFKYPSSHPPSIQQALNHWALSQTHIDLIFKNSFHTFCSVSRLYFYYSKNLFVIWLYLILMIFWFS